MNYQEEWLKCAKSFEYFADNYVEIRSLEKGRVKFHLYEYQKRVLNEFEAKRFNIVRKFRQGGLTTLAVIYALWLCMFRENKQVLVVSKTDNEAIKAGKIAKVALTAIQDKWPWLMPKLGADSKHVISFKDTNSEIEFGSVNRGRGQSLNILIIDEAAFIKNMDEVWADMYPTISMGGSVMIISTVKGTGNWYERMYRDAEAGRNQFNVINLHYTEHPDYRDPKWAAQTLANLGKKRFMQEVEGSFGGSDDTYIPDEILSRLDQQIRDVKIIKKLFPEYDSEERLFELEKDDKEPGNNDWERGAMWVWKEPVPGHDYIMGVDVAEGLGGDCDSSTISIFDSTVNEQVAEFSSNIIPPSVFAMVVARVGVFYNNAIIVIDSFGPGYTVAERLEFELLYEHLFYDIARGNKLNEKPGVRIGSTNRKAILESLSTHLFNDTVKVKSPRLLRELYTFVYDHRKGKAQAKESTHDDLVMSAALALYAKDRLNKNATSILDVNVNSLLNAVAAKRYQEIKYELEDGDWAKTAEEIQNEQLSDLLPKIQFPSDRPYNSLLKEFDF